MLLNYFIGAIGIDLNLLLKRFMLIVVLRHP